MKEAINNFRVIYQNKSFEIFSPVNEAIICEIFVADHEYDYAKGYAHLLAAAPLMYRTLEKALLKLDPDKDSEEIYQIKVALSNAKGIR